MTFFADGLRLYIALVCLLTARLALNLLRPHLLRAFQRGVSASRHVVKVAAAHIGFILLLAIDNVSEIGTPVSPSLIFTVTFTTLSFSALVDLVRSKRNAAAD